MKKKKFKIITGSIVVFISMLFSNYMDEIFMVFQYIFSSNFRAEFPLDFSSPFQFTYYIFSETYYSFDYLMTFGTYLYQFLIPIIGVLAALNFQQRYTTIEKFAFVRSIRFKDKIYHDVFNTVIIYGIICFGGFLLYNLYSISISLDELIAVWLEESTREIASRPMFTDIFGEGFYQDYRLIQILMEGFVRFFWVPVVYGVFGIAMVIKDKDNQLAPLLPLVYFYSASIIGNSMQMYNIDLSIQISPNIFMSSGDYYNMNTPVALFVNSIPFLIGLYIIRKETADVNI